MGRGGGGERLGGGNPHREARRNRSQIDRFNARYSEEIGGSENSVSTNSALADSASAPVVVNYASMPPSVQRAFRARFEFDEGVAPEYVDEVVERMNTRPRGRERLAEFVNYRPPKQEGGRGGVERSGEVEHVSTEQRMGQVAVVAAELNEGTDSESVSVATKGEPIPYVDWLKENGRYGTRSDFGLEDEVGTAGTPPELTGDTESVAQIETNVNNGNGFGGFGNAPQAGGGEVPDETEGGEVPDENEGGEVPDENVGGEVPDENEGGEVPDEFEGGEVPDESDGGEVPDENEGGLVPDELDGGEIPDDSEEVGEGEVFDESENEGNDGESGEDEVEDEFAMSFVGQSKSQRASAIRDWAERKMNAKEEADKGKKGLFGAIRRGWNNFFHDYKVRVLSAHAEKFVEDHAGDVTALEGAEFKEGFFKPKITAGEGVRNGNGSINYGKATRDDLSRFREGAEGLIEGDEKYKLLDKVGDPDNPNPNPAHVRLRRMIGDAMVGYVEAGDRTRKERRERHAALMGARKEILEYVKRNGAEFDGVDAVGFTDDMTYLAEQVKARGMAEEAIENTVNGMRIVVGESRAGAKSEARLGLADRIFNRYSSSGLGKILPPEIVAGALAVAGVAATGLKRVVPVVGAVVVGGGMAAARSRIRDSKNIAQMDREATYSDTSEAATDGRVRDKLRGVTFAGMQEAAKDLAGEISGADPREMGLSGYAEMVAKAEARLVMSARERVDLLRYSNRDEAVAERTALRRAINEAKSGIRKEAYDEVLATEVAALAESISSRQNAARKLVRNNAAKAAAKGAILGGVFSVGVQEIGALFNSNVDGLFERGLDGIGMDLDGVNVNADMVQSVVNEAGESVPGRSGTLMSEGADRVFGNHAEAEASLFNEAGRFEDESGNIFRDLDGDGRADRIIDRDRNVFFDSDGDGVMDRMQDPDGNVFVDGDGDGVFERVTDVDGNVFRLNNDGEYIIEGGGEVVPDGGIVPEEELVTTPSFEVRPYTISQEVSTTLPSGVSRGGNLFADVDNRYGMHSFGDGIGAGNEANLRALGIDPTQTDGLIMQIPKGDVLDVNGNPVNLWNQAEQNGGMNFYIQPSNDGPMGINGEFVKVAGNPIDLNGDGAIDAVYFTTDGDNASLQQFFNDEGRFVGSRVLAGYETVGTDGGSVIHHASAVVNQGGGLPNFESSVGGVGASVPNAPSSPEPFSFAKFVGESPTVPRMPVVTEAVDLGVAGAVPIVPVVPREGLNSSVSSRVSTDNDDDENLAV